MDQPTWIGRTLSGRYRIDALIGQGGMSAVYKATDPNLKRVVAIKLIHSHLSTDQSFIYRFEGEASAVASLRHPNIVQVYDFNNDGGVYYMVLEFIPGETLQDRLNRLNETGRFLSNEDVLKITINICDAIGYSHQRGMIHRDIKPANIMLDVQGQAILMDFGIVKILGGESHTSTGAVVGTARYMPPEIIRGEVADLRSDIYSLGITLFEMLGGRPPFVADSAMTLMMMHLNDPVPDVRNFHEEVPVAFVDVVKKALQKQGEHRYQSAAEMAADLRRILASMESGAGEPQATGLKTKQKPVVKIPQENAKRGVIKKAITTSLPAWLPAGIVRYALIGFIGLLIVATGVWGLSALAGSGTLVPTITSAAPVSTSTAGSTPTKISTPTINVTLTNTPFPAEITDAKGVTLRLVPAGAFMMGANADDAIAECLKFRPDCKRSIYGDEEPPHEVVLDLFYIDKYEVTNALYKTCVDAGACDPPNISSSYSRPNYYGSREFDNYPVIHVDWSMSQAYCEWRGASLPTEAQWEKAARGENVLQYPWGNDFDGSKVNFCDKNCRMKESDKAYDDGYADTAPVGSFPDGVSPYGVYYMAGNVWEWVQDWYSETYYQSSPSSNPLGPESSQFRALRGGAWNSYGNGVRPSNRVRFAPETSYDDVGFRCASTLP
jgi:serine/threonine-protein kinase